MYIVLVNYITSCVKKKSFNVKDNCKTGDRKNCSRKTIY